MDIKKNIIPQCLADNMRELQKEYQQALEKKILDLPRLMMI